MEQTAQTFRAGPLLTFRFIMAHLFELVMRAWQCLAGDSLTPLEGRPQAWAREEQLTALITGANTGLGKQHAIELAKLGYHVIITARDAERGARALEDIRREAGGGGGRVELLPLDLARLSSVRALAEELKARGTRLHLLVNNAGLFPPVHPPGGSLPLTEDGLEVAFQVNFAAPLLLIDELLGCLSSASPPARIVLLSSVAHWTAAFSVEDLQGLEASPTPPPFILYANTKLFTLMLVTDLRRRLRTQGRSDIAVAALHPGNVHTEFTRDMDPFIRRISPVILKPVAKGIRTQLLLSLAPAELFGKASYFADCRPASQHPLATDETLAARVCGETRRLLAQAEAQRKAEEQPPALPMEGSTGPHH